MSSQETGQTVIRFGSSDYSLIVEALLASKPIVPLKREESGTVAWTTEEAKQLYLKARDLWTNDKRALEITRFSLRIPMKWGTDSGGSGAASGQAALVTVMISEAPHLSQEFCE